MMGDYGMVKKERIEICGEVEPTTQLFSTRPSNENDGDSHDVAEFKSEPPRQAQIPQRYTQAASVETQSPAVLTEHVV